MRSFARALLRLTVALAAAITATMLFVANPLTHPTSVGEAAIEVEAPSVILDMGTDLILRQPESNGEEERSQPLTSQQEERLRLLLHEAFTTDWAEAAIRDAAEGMEAWMSGTRRPDVYVDLTEPKERIRSHPDALLLVAAAGVDETEDSEPDAIDPRAEAAAVDMFLADLPDQVSLVETSWWSDFTSRAGDLRDGTMRIGLISSLLAVVAAIIGVAMSPQPRLASVSSWLAWLMLWTAVPVLLFAAALTTAASGIPLPDELSLTIDVIGKTWESARLIGWISLGGALALWALTHVLRERDTATPVIQEEVDTREETPVGVG